MRILNLIVIFFFVFCGQGAFSKVFLYDGRGAWDEGLRNLKDFLVEYELEFETLGASDLIHGDLEKQAPELLIMPGGESWVYLDELGEKGAEEIRRFVNGGGGYLGICAGAFYATSHREGGAATGPYGIGLLDGVAFDATSVGVPGFIEGVVQFDWELGNPLVSGLKKSTKMLLYGGPVLKFSQHEAKKKEIEILLRFAQTLEPAMIRFRYGKGRVLLSSPHLEIKEEKGELPQHDLHWPFLHRVIQSLIQAH